MRHIARTLTLGGALVIALGGCAVIAGYDFGKYGQDPHDGGLGGAGGRTVSTSSSTGSGFPSSSSGTTTVPPAGCKDGGATGFGSLEILTGAAPGAVSIAGDASYVYWTADAVAADGGGNGAPGVYRIDKAGTTLSLLTSTYPAPRALISTDTDLFWVTHQQVTTSEIWRLTKNIVNPKATPIWSTAPGVVNDLALHGSNLYFAFDTKGVYVIDLVALQYHALFQSPAGRSPVWLAADATNVYYVDVPYPHVANQTTINWVDPVSLAGGMIAAGEEAVQGLAVDATHVYWSTTGGIRRANKLGGMPADTMPGTSGPCTALAVDESYVYCTATISNTLEMTRTNGSPGVIYAGDGKSKLQGVTPSCEAVYWVDGSSIVKLPAQ